jgi:hypothetical protein
MNGEAPAQLDTPWDLAGRLRDGNPASSRRHRVLLPAALLIAGVAVFADLHGSFARADAGLEAASPVPPLSPAPEGDRSMVPGATPARPPSAPLQAANPTPYLLAQSSPVEGTPGAASTSTPVPVPRPAPGDIGLATANSLGMKFLPVDDVEFCIWVTRVKDYEGFANAVHLKSTAWKKPGFKQGPDHPVVNVSWNEAMAFCRWLTDKEHTAGVLPPNQFYRLPTDLEWSKAVGLPPETGWTPEARDVDIPDVYPWGRQWPPPPTAGNYAGEETGADIAIKGFDDGFTWTSPVGSFPPNKYGLFDMGGNVWQWCMDTWNNNSKAKVLRGASWYNGAVRMALMSSCRVHAAPDSSTDNYGFRIVRVQEGAPPSPAPADGAAPPPGKATPAPEKE